MRRKRSWNLIAENQLFESSVNRKRHEDGFVDFVQQRTMSGWSPYFLTFQFEQMGGKAITILGRMARDIETFYRLLVTRVERFPRGKAGSKRLPILLSVADLPVFKRQKGIANVTINDGLHHHGILLLPPTSRLTDLNDYLKSQTPRHLDRTNLMTISAKPIDDNVARTVCYTLKGVTSGRLQYDDSFLLFPRSVSELP